MQPHSWDGCGTSRSIDDCVRSESGTRTKYGYDTKSRLTGVTTTGLDSRGRPVTLTSSTYTYNFADDRLTKGGDFSETYTNDPLSRLTQVKRGNQVREAYTYDKVGNRLSALNSSPWAYSDRNELQSYPGATFQYDLNGNTISKVDSTGSWTYEWDAENQLTRVLKNGTEVVRYAYDPLGRRVEKVAGAVTTTWLYDGEDILRQTVGTNVTTYIHGPGVDEPLASENAAGVRTYLHPDALGSIVKTSNSSGAAVSTLKYNAFGVLESGVPAPYAFTGREWEPESGLYYYRARYYDPKIGRFLSEDPLPVGERKIAELSAYAYVANGPVNLIDPSGECILLATDPVVIDPYIFGRSSPIIRPGPWTRFPNQRFPQAARPVRATPPRPFIPQPQPPPIIEPTPGQIVPRMPWWLKVWKALVEPFSNDGPSQAPPLTPPDCGCMA